MKIILPGGSGQIGTLLARAFHARGDEVVVLTRQAGRGGGTASQAAAGAQRGAVAANAHPAGRHTTPWRTAAWDAATLGPWAEELDGADAVVNLAGRSVNCRYTPANRREIVASRVNSVRVVGEAIARCRRPPRVWLQSSTATIYAHRYDAPNDEATGILGGGEPGAPDTWRFSIDVAKAWEQALDAADTPRTRKVALRSAMTMSPDRGGIFDVLLGLVRRGLGGRAGDGRQYVSWIHERDFIRALDWLMARDDLAGAVNVCSPNPLPNAEFMRVLREAWGARLGLPATRWMLEVGAVFMRTETELILKSRRVVPGRLLGSGFAFEFPQWREAARELCARWRDCMVRTGERASST